MLLTAIAKLLSKTLCYCEPEDYVYAETVNGFAKPWVLYLHIQYLDGGDCCKLNKNYSSFGKKLCNAMREHKENTNTIEWIF